ncbi:hypothetical protein EV667_3285 [Ancylobacter aquaticus]|uniref:Uncharacterized protein n=1 Tax=Ancylobacter aquaticus TaxID=100 RepID=A0A4R1HU64_ANCAQ|nr:hypothetical protein [Ancylobacter aquaticus]TCK23459.1 hypothetical protein EV667_3285 [Ancylobacter aquaticus]
MFSLISALLCAAVGLLLWTGVGYVLARRLALGHGLALPVAPALGWAVQNAVALALGQLIGFSPVATIGAAVLLCSVLLVKRHSLDEPSASTDAVPWWLFAMAAVVAMAPALAVLPKQVAEGVILAPAIFDHSKIALIDEIVRGGVPPVNPFFGPTGQSADVAYYYLWHFGAAQLAGLTGATGWEADAAASWFTAFSTLALMAGLARYLSGSRLAPAIALALCCTGSLRPVLEAIVGGTALEALLKPASGFAGWLFQSSWSPHHVAAAGCLVTATLLVTRLTRNPNLLSTVILALVMSAGFQSSIWVGGVVMALVAAALVPLMLSSIPLPAWPRFVGAGVAAGLLALAIASPLLVAQYHAALLRAAGSPVAVVPYAVLGPLAEAALGGAGNMAAYWLVLLVVEFPLVYIAGTLTLARMATEREEDDVRRIDVHALLTVVAVSLASSWLLVSTVGDNNDLGWRAVLPALLVLTAAAAAGIARWVEQRTRLVASLAVAAFAASVPAGAIIIAGNARGELSPSAEAFAKAPAMWAAVRRHTPEDARVANNPGLFADMTPWPVNISWALLGDRRSCFAGNELAIAFAPLSPERRAEISGRFLRTFAGGGSPDDVRALAETYGCGTVLLTALDGAWANDPFAANRFYRLAEAQAGAWRVYVAVPSSDDDAPPNSAGQSAE